MSTVTFVIKIVFMYYLNKTYNISLADNVVVAIYSYEPDREGDLGFDKGDKLKIINQ